MHRRQVILQCVFQSSTKQTNKKKKKKEKKNDSNASEDPFSQSAGHMGRYIVTNDSVSGQRRP